MKFRKLLVVWAAVVCASPGWADSQEIEAVVQSRVDDVVVAFDKGDASALANQFLADGEMIDEEGNVFRGHEELSGLFKEFFTKFPGAKLALQVESIRAIGPALAIEEGARTITTQDGKGRADLRYVTIWSKPKDQWLIASVREIADDGPPSPHTQLEPLSWLIGDWVNEGDDAVVHITYRWSEDGNYILADFDVKVSDRPASKSTQRIGWDPSNLQIRSWLFDTDGGFSHGTWTPTEKGWVIQSSAVLPSGMSGSAIVQFLPEREDRFIIKGTHRWIGGMLDDDFEVTVTRRPPAAEKTAKAP